MGNMQRSDCYLGTRGRNLFFGLQSAESAPVNSIDTPNPSQESLTQRGHVPVVLQHHVPVQCPLVGAQLLTLLAREVHRHVLECQRHHLLQKQVAAAPGPRPLGRPAVVSPRTRHPLPPWGPSRVPRAPLPGGGCASNPKTLFLSARIPGFSTCWARSSRRRAGRRVNSPGALEARVRLPSWETGSEGRRLRT